MIESIRILLVDDHTIIRQGLEAMLSHSDEFTVVGQARNAEAAIDALDETKPDVIIMDIMMEGMTGIEATRWIKDRRPLAKIIIMSSQVSKDFVAAGIKNGIDAYLPKDSSKEVLIEAIRVVMTGEKYFTQAITNLIFEDFYNAERTGMKAKARKIATGLTNRESEILQWVANGKTNQEIADGLFISIKTVETHKTNILDKLGLRNTAELVRYAIKNDIIQLD